MKYKEIPIETARKICKKHTKIESNGSKYLIQKCEECPLRRERTDEKGKKHILICYYILLDLYENVEKLEQEINTEIENTEELEKELKELNDN